ncbi:uncharacterized protein ACJ7VT_011001 [Polymixia lowei]
MVGHICCVKNCHSKSHKKPYKQPGQKLDNGISFYGFPSWKKHEGKQMEELTKRRRMAWVAAVRRADITFNNIPVSMKVCSLHFHSGKPAYEMLESHPDWKPSLLLGHKEVHRPKLDAERYARRCRRDGQRKSVKEAEGRNVKAVAEQEAEASTVEVMAEQEAEAGTIEEGSDLRDQSTQAGEFVPGKTVDECTFCKYRRDEINRLLEENRRLKRKVDELKMTESFLRDDDTKVEYYTGLPSYAMFLVLFHHVASYLPQGKKGLTHFQLLLLTLMHLRLNLPMEHISHLFHVDCKTISNAFNDTISVLHVHISSLVYWPDRDSMQASMPRKFVEAFGNCVAVIVDWLEVSTELPSNLEARPQTFSHARRCHTQKYLIGVAPQGIIFISKGWGGSTSDRHVMEDSGFLEKLLPGDMVLADRGFDIEESVGLMCAEVNRSASAGGRHRLDVKDVEEMRRIGHLRTHVERVTGNVHRKYTMLSDTMPLSMLLPCEDEDVTLLDKIVTVCCALTNMCPSVV